MASGALLFPGARSTWVVRHRWRVGGQPKITEDGVPERPSRNAAGRPDWPFGRWLGDEAAQWVRQDR